MVRAISECGGIPWAAATLRLSADTGNHADTSEVDRAAGRRDSGLRIEKHACLRCLSCLFPAEVGFSNP